MKSKICSKQTVSLIAIIIIGILLFMNSYSCHKLEYSLTAESPEAASDLTSYTPYMSLPKGEYDLTVSGSGPVSVVSSDNTLLGSGHAGEPFKLAVLKDESSIVIYGGINDTLRNAIVESDGLIFNDLIFIFSLLILGMLYLWYLKFVDSNNRQNHAVYFILILAALVASYPMFTFYVSYGNDLNFHLWRIEGIKDGLLSGQFPVRIDPSINNGYGYITSIMYPELFLYISAVLRLFSISSVTSYKTLIVIMNFATAFIMYKSVKGITKSQFTSTLAAVIYTLSVWRLYNTYYRAALGESLAMVFFPLIVYGLYEIFKGNQRKWWILSIGFTGIIQSHFISCLFSAGLCLFCFIIFFKDIKQEKRWISLIKSAVVVVLINAWYIIPFFVTYMDLDLNIQHKPTNVEFFRNAIIPAQLFNVFNDTFGRSQLTPDGIKGDISLSMGFSVTICLVVTAYYFMFEKDRKIKERPFAFGIFSFAVILLFMSTTLFPWEILQKPKLINAIIGTIQFPWRFLSIVSPLLIIVGCMTVSVFIKKEYHNTAMITTLTLCILTLIPFMTAYTTEQDAVLMKGHAISTAGAPGWDDEYFIYGTRISDLKAGEYKTSFPSIRIDSPKKEGTNITFDVQGAKNNSYVEVPLLYYPGYSAKDNNGNPLTIEAGDNNVLRVNLTNETSSVRIRYSGLLIYKIGCILSLLTLLAAIAYTVLKKKNLLSMLGIGKGDRK